MKQTNETLKCMSYEEGNITQKVIYGNCYIESIRFYPVSPIRHENLLVLGSTLYAKFSA